MLQPQPAPDRWGANRREVRNHTIDSTYWNHFRFRPGDIVTVTWAKTGTTWLQQILSQLIFEGAEGLPVQMMSPWVELRAVPIHFTVATLEAQTHRRFMKSHLPADVLPISPMAKYLYVARDGRDVLWSWHNHHRRMSPMALAALNGGPGRVGPPLHPANENQREYFHEWLDHDGYPLWPFWSHVQSWWELRHHPDVLLVHFNHLKADLAGQIRRIARFLNIDVNPDLLPTILEHCSFEYMKAHAKTLLPVFEGGLNGGSQAFIHKGTNGQWREVLTPDDIAKYEKFANRNLSPDCARWLATGEGDIG